MGSLAPLDQPASAIRRVPDVSAPSDRKKRKERLQLETAKSDKKCTHTNDKKTDGASNKRPRRAAACTNFQEKSLSEPKHDILIETNRDHLVDDEIVAVRLTASSVQEDRPNRRLTDFTFHNSEGGHQPIEMLELDDIFVSGLILENQEGLGNDKEKSVRCEGFGRMESWNISGYEDGFPVIWVSTEFADYECLKPSTGYKKIYDHFFEKARASIEVYKKVSKTCGGISDITLEELLAGVVRLLSGNKCFSSPVAIKDFLIAQGQFIYNQLIGLDDDNCKKNGQIFAQLPVLIALRDESVNHLGLQARSSITSSSGGCLTIGSKALGDDQNGLCNLEGDDENEKLAMLLQEEENWKSMKKQQRKNQNSNSLNKFYIKINEDEIANDYPLPAFYSPCDDEMDEYVLVDSDFSTCDTDLLPRSMLYNWSLYNSDSRLISLELLPMKPCADIDATIFGSGLMTTDDGSGFDLDCDPSLCSSAVGSNDMSGIPIYLSSIKEWMIEFGSTMVFVSIRTDMAWYRLGKPSKQYAPWYKPVLKTARLAISIITMLKEQSRIARLSFAQIIKKISEFPKHDKAFISSDPITVERYVVVHGQIILQQFAEFPDDKIRRCAFVFDLTHKMEERRHTKWVVNKKKVEQKHEPNLNPRATMQPVVTKRKLMQATTTRLISRIWGDYYSNNLPEDNEKGEDSDTKEGDDVEQQVEDNEDDEPKEESTVCPKEIRKACPLSKRNKLFSTSHEIKWVEKQTGITSSGRPLYREALVRGHEIGVGGAALIETDESSEYSSIYFVEFMFELEDGSKMFHGRKLQRGSETVLGNAANEREVFLTNECTEFNLDDVKEAVVVDIRLLPWGHQHRKENSNFEKDDRERAEERKRKGLPMEFYCKNVYCPERGGFFSISHQHLGLGTGVCNSCKCREAEKMKEKLTINSSKSCFTLQGIECSVNDFVFVSPQNFSAQVEEQERFKGGRNIGLKAYVICQLLDLVISKVPKEAEIGSTQIKVRRFFRPEDISAEKAHCSDIREVYYSEEIHTLPIDVIEGKCQVRKKHDLPSPNYHVISEHVFFCEHIYDPSKGSLKLLPAKIKICYSHDISNGQTSDMKKKGKCKEVEEKCETETTSTSKTSCLATLDIFSGCGGLSEGLQQSGISKTKWAIEYEEPAGDAFKLNHPDALVFVKNCNVILRAIMEKCGDVDDCISTPEAAEMAASLGDKMIGNLPLPGQVDFINGGPPCQGFSGMNRFNQSTWSKVQCEMILAFLSFAEYFRPKYFLLENVRNFVSYNKGQTFHLTLASLLEMGYQVRFGILEAGVYGVSQSRKRAFIWAASPEEILPEWPEPLHVFAVPELRIMLSDSEQYAAVRSTANGAPFRAITVRDTIGDLPPVGNGASRSDLEYPSDAVSWFQKKIRLESVVLTDHISKEMNELNYIRCQRIPKRPGADWHDLLEEKVKLSNGQVVDLIPWCLPNTAKRHNQWKGLFGRLDWDGNFPTSVTDPQPMGKVGMCFHPDQDRIITVRECARSQGFPDSYMFSGNIQHKHRQIGNAVPPPLAFALGLKLREAVAMGKA